MGLDKKPVMPLSKALRRSSSNALAVMARIGIFAKMCIRDRSNAIKFTPAGGTVSVRVRQLAGAVRGCGQYEFRVKDNGIGMSQEFAKKIFEPFERERTSTVSRIQGTGLGMAITKNIVDMMGGTIEVQTAQGKGSEFIIHVPMRAQAEHLSLIHI